MRISIHAPREGSDPFSRPAWRPGRGYFYPRSPRGERPGQPSFEAWQDWLISIHAPREGSDPLPDMGRDVLCISIHAPREGSDQPFQLLFVTPLLISIHAPREGSDDYPVHTLDTGLLISIHAPREGSDPAFR